MKLVCHPARSTTMAVLLYPEESYKIVGVCFAVYNDKGCGFLELYQECLEIEFRHLQIPAVAKPELVLSYRGQNLEQTYEPDFVCCGKIIVEIKARQRVDRQASRSGAELPSRD